MTNVSVKSTLENTITYAYQAFRLKNNTLLPLKNNASIVNLQDMSGPKYDFCSAVGLVSVSKGNTSQKPKIEAIAPKGGSEKGINLLDVMLFTVTLFVIYSIFYFLFGSEGSVTIPILGLIIIGSVLAFVKYNYFNYFIRKSKKVERVADERGYVFCKDIETLQNYADFCKDADNKL